MSKSMKRLLAAILVTSMLSGTNGVSYAAEAVTGGTTGTTLIRMLWRKKQKARSRLIADTVTENSAFESEQKDPVDVEEISAEVTNINDDVESAGTEEETGGIEEVEEEIFSAGKLSYPGEDYGKDYMVTLSYGADAEIPAGAELKVREIEKDTEEYKAYLQGAQKEVEEGKGVANARFFDITIRANGEIQATHFDNEADEPEVKEVIETEKVVETEKGGVTEANDKGVKYDDAPVYVKVVTTDTPGTGDIDGTITFMIYTSDGTTND